MPPLTCLQLLAPQKQNILPCSSCRRFLHNAPEELCLGPWAEAVFHSWRLVTDNIFSATPFHWGDATAHTSHPCKIPYNTKAKQSGRIHHTVQKPVENSAIFSITSPSGLPSLAPKGPLCRDTPCGSLPAPSPGLQLGRDASPTPAKTPQTHKLLQTV